MNYRSELKLVLWVFSGLIFGVLLPVVFITFDLNQLGLEFNLQNTIEVSKVQYIYLFSAVFFPAVFATIFFLFYTVQKRNHSLREVNDFVTSVLNSLHDNILVFSENLEIIGANDASKNMLGYFVGGDQKYRGIEEIRALINKSGDFDIYKESLNGEGTYLISVKKLLAQNKIIVSIKDIHQISAQEKIIEDQKRELEAASKFAGYGEMAAGMAHEINNPLAILLLNNNLVMKFLEKGVVDDNVKAKIKKNDEVIKRISKIINTMKSLSRNAADDPVEQASVVEVVDDAMEFCRGLLNPEGVALDVNFSGLEEARILCKKAEVSQVLVNLIKNSKDALDEISDEHSKWIRLCVLETKDRIQIRVIDSGKGIDKEIHEKLFDPFFTTKQVGKGMGLGLSISKNLLLKQGGDLYYSLHHGNTCFTLEFKKSDSFPIKIVG